MVCLHCGAPVAEEALACTECGTRVPTRELIEGLLAEIAFTDRRSHTGVDGWLLFLLAWLCLFSPLVLVAFLLQVFVFHEENLISAGSSFAVSIRLAIAFALTCYGIYAGVSLNTIAPNAVAITKRYLAAYGVALVILAIAERGSGGKFYGILEGLVWVLLWYAYLERSKRIAATYPQAAH